MIKSMLLVNREWQMNREDSTHVKMLSFPSVKNFGWWNQTSSAGDWEGYIIQKINGRFFLIPVFRENNYPHAGFTLTTGNIFAEFETMPNQGEIYEILQEMEF